MTPMKKVEIVTDLLELTTISRALEELGVSGYTIVRDVTGHGGRGRRTGDDITGVFQNSYVMAVCTPELAERIVEMIRPILKRYGGIALVSDCLWVKH